MAFFAKRLASLSILFALAGCVDSVPASSLGVCIEDGMDAELATLAWGIAIGEPCWVDAIYDDSIDASGTWDGEMIRVNPNTPYPELVLAHEIGHAIGYGHSDDPCDIMTPYLGVYNVDCIERNLRAVREVD